MRYLATRFVLIVSAVACSTLVTPPFEARADINVPADAPTIQGGVDLASSGETVFVAPGTYPESVTVPSGVSLVGAGATTTVIDGTGLLTAGIAVGGSSGTTVISGFHIRDHGGYGVFSGNGARTEVRDCLIENTQDGVHFNSDGVVRDCVIRNVRGVGVFAYRGGFPAPVDPLVENNIIVGAGMVGIGASHQSRPLIVNNTVVGCGTSGTQLQGSGLFADDTAAEVRNNIFAFNGAGGVFVVGPSLLPTFSCNDAYLNVGSDYAGVSLPTPDSFSLDPLFCDQASGDFSLLQGSPCLPGNHPDGATCGLIGARGQGCGAPTATEAASWGQIKGEYR